MDGNLPVDQIGLDLPGLFALGMVSVAAWLAGLLAMMVVLLAGLALTPLLVLTSSTAQSVRDAERTKTRAVHDEVEIEVAAADIAVRNRKVFAPRLVVLRVATPVWQQAVRRLAQTSALALVDVSQPTDNLVWEIEELTVRSPTRCLLVGELGRLRELAAVPVEELDPASAAARTLRLLEGRRVLGYTTDRAGVRRFARALRSDLYGLDR